MKDVQGWSQVSKLSQLFPICQPVWKLGCKWDVSDRYEFCGFQGVWSLPLGDMTPGLLEGNVSLITINRAGIQKATAALISFKVHTHPICAQKELNRSRKNKFSLVTGAAQKGGWWQVLADPRHSISACVRVGEIASSGMSCSCLELVPCQPNWWFWSKIVKLKKKNKIS